MTCVAECQLSYGTDSAISILKAVEHFGHLAALHNDPSAAQINGSQCKVGNFIKPQATAQHQGKHRQASRQLQIDRSTFRYQAKGPKMPLSCMLGLQLY